MLTIRRNSGARARHAAVTALLTVTTALGAAIPLASSAHAQPISPSTTTRTVAYGATTTTAKTVAQREADALSTARAKYVGKVPYRFGGTSPSTGFDCSGMTRYAYKTAGLTLPRTASDQRAATKRISRSAARAGDLVFFHSGGRVSHVGIYAGGNMMVDAGNARVDIRYRAIYSSAVTFGTLR